MTYELHPLADIIPEASPEDFAALVESIRAVGQLEPIRLWDGRVIDGRHRMRACEELGIEPVFRVVPPEEVGGGTDAGLLAYVLALNINRRHATTSQRAIAAAKAVTTEHGGNRSKSSNDDLSRERAATLFNVGTATLDRARQLINEADARVVDLVARGALSLNAALDSHHQLSALAAEQEAQGVDPDFTALAAEIDRLKRTNSKLRASNKALEAAGTDQNAQARAYADELERTRAELAKAQARIEAADKGLTVSPPKIVFREDPEKDRLLLEQREMIAALKKAKAEAEHKAKYNEALLAKADAQVIDKSTRLAQVEAPDAYLTAYTSGIVDDFNRRTRGAIGAVQRSGVVPAPEMIHQVETARALLDELLDLCRDRGAHEGAAALPALEVLS
jgi:ParB-like chromosome segregation protein Spo0J